jgi:hypothetical protein
MSWLQWTGNPFVDTGLAVIVAEAKIARLEELTPQALQKVVGDGSRLADANRRLKAFSIVLGSNSPLMNAGTNPGLVLSNLKRKIADASAKLGEIDKQIEEERDGKNREKKLLQLSNQKAKQRELLQKLKVKLEGRQRPRQAMNDRGLSAAPLLEEDPGLKEYQIVIQALLEDVLTGAHSKQVLCECTGILPATNALQVASQRIREQGNAERADFVIGRDWFPLAGSIGNDAQALPSASRSPQISALALLTVQFLPLGVQLLNGQLVLFQSTEPTLTQYIVGEIYRETLQKLEVGSDKVEIRGSKAGTTPTAAILLKYFGDLRSRIRREHLPPHTTVNLWQFSNSGTGASADVTSVPHPALEFLWQASIDFNTELKQYLQNEKKVKPDYQLLTSIQRGREYLSFYPFKGQKPASIGLFELYQKLIRGRSPAMLQMAQFVASKLRKIQQSPDAPKHFKKLEKDLGQPAPLLRPLKGLLAEWAQAGDFTLNDYALLFPCDVDEQGQCQRPVNVAPFDSWRLVWFYLNHELADVSKPDSGDETVLTHPKIKQFAADLFSYYEKKMRLDQFQKRILQRLRREEITNYDLREAFVRLAEEGFEGYTSEAWDDLCRDESGNNVTYEVRFQLRLELSNLYAQSMKRNQAAKSV